VPIGAEEGFTGVVDLLTGRAYAWSDDDKGKTYHETTVPADLRATVAHWREVLLETAAVHDDPLLEQYLAGPERVTAEALQRAIRKATVAGQLVPVLVGSAFRNKGVQPLLDAVAAYLPSPLDLPPVTGRHPHAEREETRRPDAGEPLAALAFKLVSDPFVGKLTFLRLYAGTLAAGSYVVNARTGKKERVARLLQMHADQREALSAASAGDIVAVVGLRDVRTGDTLYPEGHPIVLETVRFPEPVIGYAIEAKRAADADRLGHALGRLLDEDPTLHLRTSPETGQTVLSGMGELHLEVALSRLSTDFGVEVQPGPPQVAYREALGRPATHRKLYKRQNGGSGSFADITFTLEPGEPGKEGLEFVNAVTGGAIPREFVPAVQKGFDTARQQGPLGGYPVASLRVTLLDGAFHREDSDAQSFEMAALLGFREAAPAAAPHLLEPVMAVTVTAPEACTGAVIADLNRRRGTIKGLDARGNTQVIAAEVPLAKLFGYVTALRTLSSGRAEATLTPSHYAAVPAGLAEAVLAGAPGEGLRAKGKGA
jgi:elongation factor G